MKKVFLCTGMAAAIAAAVTTYVLARDCTPESQILSAIQANLTAIGSLTADVSCTCSNDALSFADGALYVKGAEQTAMWRGADNSQVRSNGTYFNVADPRDNATFGFLWNDSSGNQWASWALTVGYSDPRAALGAALQATDLELVTGTEVVNTVTCYKLVATGQRLWVDSSNTARVIRWEFDYQGGVLASRADYTGWTTMGGADVPTELDFEVFDGNGNSWRRFEFSLSNVQVGVSLDDSMFGYWTPPDSSTPD